MAAEAQLSAAQGASAAQPLLPVHLQAAVHRALSDLQAQRLLYPQQCAAAEELGCCDREQAERRTLAALGGGFGYAAARSELDDAHRASKALARQWSKRSGDRAGVAAAAAWPAEIPALTASQAAWGGVDDLWGSFEAFSAALAAEVDRRIAAARLRPAAAPVRRTRQPAGSTAAREQLLRLERRQPLGSLQAEGGAQPAAATAAPSAARKRERSPRPTQQLGPALAAPASVQGRCKRGNAVMPPAAPARPPVGSPASKRRRPHVAFGTRCEAPRPRSQRPVKLEAEQAPSPPQLPPVQPAPEGQGRLGGVTAAAAVAGDRADAQPDLLRLLAATFAAPACEEPPCGAACAAGQADGAGDFDVTAGSTGASQLQQLLADLTAALNNLPQLQADLASDGDSGTRPALACQSSRARLSPVLERHGIQAAAVRDAGSLLQAVLDRMDAISADPHQPPAAAQAAQEAVAGPPPARAQPGVAAAPAEAAQGPAAAPPAPESCAAARALCNRFDQLLHSSGSELREVQRQLAAAKQAEAAVGRIREAALEAAVQGAEAAAAACTAAHPACKQHDKPHAGLADQGRAGPAVLAEAAAAAPMPPEEPPAATQHSHEQGTATSISGSPGGCPAHQLLAAVASPQPDAEPQPKEGAQAQPPAGATAATVEAAADEPALGWPAACQGAAPAALAGLPAWPGALQGLLPPFNGPVPAPVPVQPAALPTQAFVTYHGQALMSAPGLTWQPPALQQPQQRHEAAPEQPDVAVCEGLASPSCSVSTGANNVSDGDCASSSSAEGVALQPEAVAAAGCAEDEEGLVAAAGSQALLDEMAELAIKQYKQHAAAEEALDGGAAWDAAARAMSGSLTPAHDAAPSSRRTAAEEQQAEHPAASAEALLGEQASCAEAQPGVAVPLPAALGVPPRPPPYNPLRAGAAAAQRERDAAAWRQLRERADRLVLWHEYASALGIGGEEIEQEKEQGEQPHALQLPQPPPAEAALDPTAERLSQRAQLCSASTPVPACDEAGQQAQRKSLWRPAGTGPGTERAPEAASGNSEPATPPPPGSAWTGETVPPAGSSTSSPSSEGGSSPLSSTSDGSGSSQLSGGASGGSSIGVAGRHKARALRYRLLRRQLELATGLACSDCSLLRSAGGGSPSLSHCSDIGASEGPCACDSLPTGWAAAPRASSPPLQGHPVRLAPASPSQRLRAAPVAEAGPEATPWPEAEEAEAEAEADAEAEAEAHPAGAACAVSAAASQHPPRRPPPVGPITCLADHLSDATTSTAGTPASGGSLAERLTLMSSSCSTLGTLGAAGRAAHAHTAAGAATALAGSRLPRGGGQRCGPGGSGAQGAPLAACAARQAGAEAATLKLRSGPSAGTGPYSTGAAAAAVICTTAVKTSTVPPSTPLDAAVNVSVRASSGRGLAALRALKERLAAGRRPAGRQ